MTTSCDDNDDDGDGDADDDDDEDSDDHDEDGDADDEDEDAYEYYDTDDIGEDDLNLLKTPDGLVFCKHLLHSFLSSSPKYFQNPPHDVTCCFDHPPVTKNILSALVCIKTPSQ